MKINDYFYVPLFEALLATPEASYTIRGLLVVGAVLGIVHLYRLVRAGAGR